MAGRFGRRPCFDLGQALWYLPENGGFPRSPRPEPWQGRAIRPATEGAAMDLLPIRRAILSVTDKSGLAEFAGFLAGRGFAFLAFDEVDVT